jgi:hypothetical protein
MKKCLLVLLVAVGTARLATAQQYTTAIGIKGGFSGHGALSLKHFFEGPSAVEFNLGGGAHTIWLQGLYERNTNIQDRLDWYWGVGGDIGFWSKGYHYYNNHYNDDYYDDKSGVWGGVDGVIGLEYTFDEIPINLALDVDPTIRLFPYIGFDIGAALAARIAIK